LEKNKLEIIPFGVDTNIFRPYNVLKDKKMFQILSVGYLIERKGFEYLINSINEILKIHDNVKLKIVGTGPLENQIKKQIKELKLEGTVEILGNVSEEELLDLYNSSEIFVLPSIVDSQGNTEGLGVVLLEAMACKVPVIASNIGGIPDIVHDKVNGTLVPEKDVLELTRAIDEMIKHEEFRKSMALNGYEMVKGHFSWEQIAKDYIDIYKETSRL
jgi:glycosyltransferase involved in cell wall biosynthesis